MYENISAAIQDNNLNAVKAFLNGPEYIDIQECLDLAAALDLDDICEALISHMEADKETQHSQADESVAVIGMAARFPGIASDVNGFYQLLAAGEDAVTEFPSDRWHVEDYYSPVKGVPGKSCTKFGAFIQQDVASFDAHFFNINSTEATYLDPQQRLLMEVVYEALESANIPTDKMMNSDTAVYVGISTQDYGTIISQLNIAEAATAYTATGNGFSTAAGRIAYWLGCQGPTMSIDTACSSSLVALHQAVQSIRRHESRMAIVGGVHLMLSPGNFINFSQAGILSLDGKCKTFDASADGYGRGEGCGVVVLKTLSQALQDNDPILAVIRGSAVNQDGRSSALTAPNGPAQERLMRSALAQAGLQPNDIDYIEAHGTGTQLGDPIELNAIKSVFSTPGSRKDALMIGTAKTYLGHLEAAAGIAGLIKTILSLQHKKVPKLLNFKQLNPYIDLKNANIRLVTETASWPNREGHTRRAGVSSFGFSGTNAHVILEEAPEVNCAPVAKNSQEPQLFLLSAKKQAALEALKARYVSYLQNTEDALADIAYTSAVGRTHFTHRLAVVAHTKEELVTKLMNGGFDDIDTKEPLHSLAKRYLSGATIDWTAHYASQATSYAKVNLPNYVFQRQRYWVSNAEEAFFLRKTSNPFLDGPVTIGNGEYVYIHTLTAAQVKELSGHVIFDTPIMPGPGYIGLMLMACQAYAKKEAILCQHIEIIAPMVIQSKAAYQVLLKPNSDDNCTVEFYSRQEENDEWQLHAKGLFLSTVDELVSTEAVDLNEVKQACPGEIDHQAFYAGLSLRGYHYQENFQGVEKFYYGKEVFLAKVNIGKQLDGVHFHPAFLDVCLHASLGGLLTQDTALNEAYLPIGVDRVETYRPLPECCYVYSQWLPQEQGDSYGRGDITVYDEHGELVACFFGMVSKKTSAENLRHIIAQSSAKVLPSEKPYFYDSVWEKLPQVVAPPEIAMMTTPWIVILENSLSLDVVRAKMTLYFTGVTYICLDQLTEEIKPAIDLEKLTSASILYVCEASLGLSFDLSLVYEKSLSTSQHLLEWTQRIAHLLRHSDSRFWVVTQQVNAVAEHPIELNLSQSFIKGFMRSLSLECAEADIKHIDMELNLEKNLDCLLQEMQHPSEHTEITYRDQHAWKEYCAPAHERFNLSTTALRTDKTYIITGGLGGIGWGLCEWLLSKGALHIVLLGRRDIDENKHTQLMRWAGENKQVFYIQCDITDEKAIRDLVTHLNKKMPVVGGLFHAAGSASIKPFTAQQHEDFAVEFSTKIKGTCLLYEIFHEHYGEQLDFMMLFSSITALFGSPGMLSYAASNAFMDSFVQAIEQHKTNTRVISINWGPWADIGMVNHIQQPKRTSGFGLSSMPSRQYFDVLEKVLLHSYVNTIGIADINFDEIHALFPKVMNRVKGVVGSFQDSKKKKSQRIDSNWLKDILTKEEKAQRQLIFNTLKEMVRTVNDSLGEHLLQEHIGFTEMGLDSLMAVDLKNKIQALLGESIPLRNTVIFDHPTLGKLSDYLAKEIRKLDASAEKNSVRHRSAPLPRQKNEPIAIIGMGLRMPSTKVGAGEDLSSYWQLFAEDEDAVGPIPESRWNNQFFYSEDKEATDKMYVNQAAFLSGPMDQFDAAFFNISPVEANYLDPQQRLLLECTWEALENAGIPAESLHGKSVGVYVGISSQDYAELLSKLPSSVSASAYSGTGNAMSTAAGRIAYSLGCEGPAMSIDTACSSSLVALHQAMGSLRSGESQMAIVAGVNLMFSPTIFINFSRARMLSNDGRCKAFDADADGYGRGEGCGVIILKPLSQALQDNDNILSVVRGSAVNQDGRSSGLTVPNGPAQERLIRTALEQAQLHPNDIDYIDAHGTGTRLGDPIELNALDAVFSTEQPREKPLLVGTAKSSIGHLEAAAGIAGLIKTVLALQHNKIPRLLHFKQLNPHIDLSKGNIQFPLRAEPWLPSDHHLRRAGISSFGFSGTNAHVILEEAPRIKRSLDTDNTMEPKLFVLSAKTKPALQALVKKYLDYLPSTVDSLSDIAYTSSIGRSHFSCRLAVMASTIPELCEKLQEENDQGLDDVGQRYLAGETIDWAAYYVSKNKAYRKVMLPTYAFQRQRYWLPQPAHVVSASFLEKTDNLFLDTGFVLGNSEQVYAHTLSAEEAAELGGHIIFDTPIMPGPGYIGLMLMACQSHVKRANISCSDIEIIAPMLIQSGASYQILLTSLDETKWQVMFYSRQANQQEWQLHAKAVFKPTDMVSDIVKPVALRSFLDECSEEITHEEFYNGLALRGYQYQGEFKRVSAFYYGQDTLLAKVELGNHHEKVSFHPVALDICLHAMLGSLLVHKTPLQEAYLPIGVENIEIYGPLPRICYVHSKMVPQQAIEKGYSRADIDLYNEEGYLVACFSGVVTRKANAMHLKNIIQHTAADIQTYVPQWEALPKLAPTDLNHTAEESWVILAEDTEDLALLKASMQSEWKHVHYLMATEPLSVIEEYASVLYVCSAVKEEDASPEDLHKAVMSISERLLACTKSLSTVLQRERSRLWVVTHQKNMAQSMAKGFMRSLVLERPDADIKHIDMDADFSTNLGLLLQEMRTPSHETEVSYRDHQRGADYLVPTQLRGTSLTIQPYKTYLITGGLGGIGWSLCEWLLEKGANHIALVGRQEIDAAKQVQIDQWQAEGRNVRYDVCNVAISENVNALIVNLAKMPPVTGIFHAAGTMSVKPLDEQQIEDFAQDTESKVLGTCLLHRAFSKHYAEDLSFMVLFSSVSSALGSPGLLSYAASNAFMDSFARAMSTQPQQCRVVAIEWSPWAEVGMVKRFQAETKGRLGFNRISTLPALSALESVLSTANSYPLVSVLDMDWDEVNTYIPKALRRVKNIKLKKQTKVLRGDSAWLKEAMAKTEHERLSFVLDALKQALTTVAGLSVEHLREDMGFSEMGLDSLMSVDLKNRIQALFGENIMIRNTIIFDYPTLGQLSQYLSGQINDFANNSDKKVYAPRKPNMTIGQQRHQTNDAIAVVGIGLRMPHTEEGAGGDLLSYWQLLSGERDAVREIPKTRWDNKHFYSADEYTKGTTYVNHASFLSGEIDQFDAAFFNIPPVEAHYLDPQQRLLLECAWEALEHAGIRPEQVRGQSVGVYVGMSPPEYAELLGRLPGRKGASAYSATGNSPSTAAGRLAYWLGCEGPTMSIDTACSSSLVALHQAVNSIRLGECHTTIVAGVNVMLSPSSFINFSDAHMLSKDGRCKTFDAQADGYGRGEGCAVIILKSLSQAKRDHDSIYALIRGSAVNQDGRSSGLTVPNGPAQERLIRSALQQARLEPNDIDYIEAHGTGTSLGDPIELNALKAVFSTETPRETTLIVGTAKSHVGHLEAAAGMAGLIKTILSLQHAHIPALLHFSTLNPHIDLRDTAITLAVEPQAWSVSEQRIRRAGVSSFGFSGTNAHVILEEAPVRSRDLGNAHFSGPQLIVFSAKTEASLRMLKDRYLNYLAKTSDVLADIAYSSAVGRSHFSYRSAIFASSVTEFSITSNSVSRPATVVFLFTGQGSQYVNMARELYETQPVFKSILDECATLLEHELPQSFYSVLFDDNQSVLLNQTQYAQPLLFSIEYALAQFWIHLGVVPQRLLGHSVGEFAAAVVAGVMTLPEALTLVSARGRLMQALPEHQGGMLVLQVSHSQALGMIEGTTIHIAGINAPNQIVVSGDLDSLARLKKRCDLEKIKATQLSVSHAFHSQHMLPMIQAFREIAESIQYHKPKIPMVSTVTGQILSEITAHYWCEQIISPVDYATAIRSTVMNEHQLYLEVGPSSALTALGQQCIKQDDQLVWAFSIKPGKSNRETLLMALSQAYLAGCAIRWSNYYEALSGIYCKIDLPKYAFQRERYWLYEPGVDLWTQENNSLLSSSDAAPIVTYMPIWEKLPELNVRALGNAHARFWIVVAESSEHLPILQETVSSFFENVQYICLENLSTAEKEQHLLALSQTASVSLLYFCGAYVEKTLTSVYSEALLSSQRLLEWTQALSSALNHRGTRFWVVTHQINAVLDAENNINLSQSVLKGFMRSLVLECPEADIKHIDIGADIDYAVEQLLLEMQEGDEVTEVTYRQHERWSERLIPQPLISQTPFVAEAEFSYLITGGLGGIGWSLCQWLLNAGAKNIILIGRREIDALKQEKIAQWRKEGNQIDYYICDVAQQESINLLLDQLSDWPTVKGIFHTAGLMTAKLMVEHKLDDFTENYQAKVQGTCLLYQAFSQRYAETLDFMVLFSSIASSLGSPGVVSYAASNAFMDSFAAKQSSCRILTMNWGPWSDVGMITQFEQKAKSPNSRLGYYLLSPQLALATLGQALAMPSCRRVSVMDMDWHEIYRYTPKAMQRMKGVDYQITAENKTSRDWLKELKNKDDGERSIFIMETILEKLSVITGTAIKKLNKDTLFTEIGLDSLLSIQLKRELEDILGDEVLLPNTLLLDYPSIGELSAYLSTQIIIDDTGSARTILEKELVDCYQNAFSGSKMGIYDALQFQKVTLSQVMKFYQAVQRLIESRHLDEINSEMLFEQKNIAAIAFYISCSLEMKTEIQSDTLFTSVKKSKKEMIAKMVSTKARDINMADDAGKTALHLAVQLKLIDMALWLVSQGCNLNQATQLGVTPLMLALFSEQFDMVKAFLKFLPVIDPVVSSLPLEENIQRYLTEASILRCFILESSFSWITIFKDNLDQGRAFFERVEGENIENLLKHVPQCGFFITYFTAKDETVDRPSFVTG